MKPSQFIVTLYVVLFVGLGAGAGTFMFDAWGEYKQLQVVEAVSKQRLATEEARLAAQQKVLERLQTDPVYVEKVLRERWGYARSGDVIFRFPTQP